MAKGRPKIVGCDLHYDCTVPFGSGLSSSADISVEQFEQHKHLLSGKVLDRATHVIYECERVNKAVQAMQLGDLQAVGQILNQSHNSLQNLYEVTGIELDTLAHTAQAYPYCIGSRMTGAGFGGCTISLVLKCQVEHFKQHVGEIYEQTIGYKASFYEATIVDGIIVEKL